MSEAIIMKESDRPIPINASCTSLRLYLVAMPAAHNEPAKPHRIPIRMGILTL